MCRALLICIFKPSFLSLYSGYHGFLSYSEQYQSAFLCLYSLHCIQIIMVSSLTPSSTNLHFYVSISLTVFKISWIVYLLGALPICIYAHKKRTSMVWKSLFSNQLNIFPCNDVTSLFFFFLNLYSSFKNPNLFDMAESMPSSICFKYSLAVCIIRLSVFALSILF